MNIGLTSGADKGSFLLQSKSTISRKGHNNRVGRIGENLARQYLQKHGYYIWKKNWTTQAGELDIVAINKEFLVFVEVKTRLLDTATVFDPFDAVDDLKQKHLQKTADSFIEKYRPILSYKRLKSFRFDIIGVYLVPKFKKIWLKEDSIIHYQNSFEWQE